MDYQSLVQAIGSVGFPIVACCAMFYLYNITINNLSNALNKMDKTLDMICEKLSLDKDK